MMKAFWKEKLLRELSSDEWEALCDGCTRCCVLKELDEETGEVSYTDVACRYLDLNTCRCTCYSERKALVPECVNLSPEHPEHFAWLPSTCAYRRLNEGKDLPAWHPLVTGDPDSTKDSGMSVRNRVISETEAFHS